MPARRRHSPFERLRDAMGASKLRCRACGYRDADGDWEILARGRQVQYRHVCPKCDAVDVKEVSLRSSR